MKKHLQQSKLSISKPSFWLIFGRGIALGWQNLWRNKMLSLATILVIAIMICIFNSLMAVSWIAQNALMKVNEKIDVVVYLKDDIGLYDALYLKQQIALFPGVKSVDYISKDKALALISQTYPQTADFLLKFNLPNPLPPSLSIVTHQAEDHDKILKMIAGSRLQEFVDQGRFTGQRDDQQILSSTARNLININSFVKQLVFWVVFIFLLGSTLVVINAIQLTVYARKNEIAIMRLVGATPGFIRLPFLVEAFLYAVLAMALSLILLLLVSNTLGVSQLLFEASEQVPHFARVFVAELGITVILNVLCSFFTVQNYLKRHLHA